MVRITGCVALERRLDRLVEAAGSVREALDHMADDPGNPLNANGLGLKFDQAAGDIANALGDINQRLDKLREVLVIINRRPSANRMQRFL